MGCARKHNETIAAHEKCKPHNADAFILFRVPHSPATQLRRRSVTEFSANSVPGGRGQNNARQRTAVIKIDVEPRCSVHRKWSLTNHPFGAALSEAYAEIYEARGGTCWQGINSCTARETEGTAVACQLFLGGTNCATPSLSFYIQHQLF